MNVLICEGMICTEACRVEMIENFYASHIKTNLNAASINVRRA